MLVRLEVRHPMLQRPPLDCSGKRGSVVPTWLSLLFMVSLSSTYSGKTSMVYLARRRAMWSTGHRLDFSGMQSGKRPRVHQEPSRMEARRAIRSHRLAWFSSFLDQSEQQTEKALGDAKAKVLSPDARRGRLLVSKPLETQAVESYVFCGAKL